MKKTTARRRIIRIVVEPTNYPFIVLSRDIAEANGWKSGDIATFYTAPFRMTDRGDIVVRSNRVYARYEQEKKKRRRSMRRAERMLHG